MQNNKLLKTTLYFKLNSHANFGKKQAKDIIDKNYNNMQDTAIAAIGRLQLKRMKDLEPVDLYIQNMYPGKEFEMILIVFEY